MITFEVHKKTQVMIYLILLLAVSVVGLLNQVYVMSSKRTINKTRTLESWCFTNDNKKYVIW